MTQVATVDEMSAVLGKPCPTCGTKIDRVEIDCSTMDEGTGHGYSVEVVMAQWIVLHPCGHTVDRPQAWRELLEATS